MDCEKLFWQLATELAKEDPRIIDGTIMNGPCLRVGKEFLALVNPKGSGLVVNLPKKRVARFATATPTGWRLLRLRHTMPAYGPANGCEAPFRNSGSTSIGGQTEPHGIRTSSRRDRSRALPHHTEPTRKAQCPL